MASTTVRLAEEHVRMLRELAKQSNESMQIVLGKAIESYRRQLLLQATNDAYACLKADAVLWAEEVAERQIWEFTLGDGLEDRK
ncbi:MAG: toxin-antitoxin system protein [Firmicutes bacterium]|nr:toxin-antitoxin system protein [Dethiobacter sp.]MBS3887855.1 toxin-antitoxin system protein [Bacillota bacterium]MBS4053446.1 toxin-antitoxin system protein [Thermaerobacter sp.]